MSIFLIIKPSYNINRSFLKFLSCGRKAFPVRILFYNSAKCICHFLRGKRGIGITFLYYIIFIKHYYIQYRTFPVKFPAWNIINKIYIRSQKLYFSFNYPVFYLCSESGRIIIYVRSAECTCIWFIFIINNIICYFEIFIRELYFSAVLAGKYQ